MFVLSTNMDVNVIDHLLDKYVASLHENFKVVFQMFNI